MITQVPKAESGKLKAETPMRPQPGTGTLLSFHPANGYSVSADAARARFPHPWKPSFFGGAIKLSRGLVEGFEPKIGGVPMSQPQAVLKLDPALVNDRGESWCCVEVEADATGTLTEESRIEIVQAAAPRSFEDKAGRHPLVLLLWKEDRVAAVHEVAFFNLQYTRVQPAIGAARHLFF